MNLKLIIENALNPSDNTPAPTPESNPDQNSELFMALAAEFLMSANPSDRIFDILSSIKQKGLVPELVNYLNSLGEEDENNWVVKDKLIKFLFQYYK